MLSSKKKILILVLTLSLLAPFNIGCDKDKVRQVAKAEDTVAQAQLNLASFLKDSETNGTLTQADVQFLKPFLIAINDANGQAIQFTKDLVRNPADVDAQTRLLSAISIISSNLANMNANGLLRIKNPAMKTVFSGLILAVQSAVSGAVVVLYSIKKKGS